MNWYLGTSLRYNYGNLAGTPTVLHTSLLYGKLVGTPTIQCAAVETSLPCHGAVGTSLLYGNPVPHSSAIRPSLPYRGPVGTTLPYGNKVGIPTAQYQSSTSQPYHELVPRYIPTI